METDNFELNASNDKRESSINFEKKLHIVVLLLILIAVLALFINKARIPFFLAIPAREAQTASLARYFYNSGIDLLRPKYDLTPAPQYLLQEFPIYQAVIAVIYHIVGFHEVWGKYVSVLALIGSIIYIYLLSNHYFKHKFASVIAAMLFAAAPFTIRFYPIFMIDPTTLFLSLVTLFHGIRWIENNGKEDFWVFFVSGFLAILIKFIFLMPVCVALLVVFLGSIRVPLKNEIKRISQFFSSYIFWGLSLILWVIWSSYLNNQTTLQAFNDSVVQFNIIDKWFGSLATRFNPMLLDSLHWITGAFVPVGVFPWLFYALLFIGLIVNLTKSRRRFGILMVSWIIGFVGILLVFFQALSTHIYYWLPAVPIAALLLASEVDIVFGFIQDVAIKVKLNSKLLNFLLFMVVLLAGETGVITGLHLLMKGFNVLHFRIPNQFDYFTGLIIFLFVSALWVLIVYCGFYKQLLLKTLLSVIIVGSISITYYSNLFYPSEQFWVMPPDLGIHWSTLPLLLRETEYIKQNHVADKPIVIVTKYNYYPQILYYSNAHGYTFRYPENNINSACVSQSGYPVFLSTPCVSLIHQQGIEDVFVVFYDKLFDMKENDFKNLAPSLHLKLVGQMMPQNAKLYGNVLHYQVDLP